MQKILKNCKIQNMFCTEKHWNFPYKNFNKSANNLTVYQKLVLNENNQRKRVN